MNNIYLFPLLFLFCVGFLIYRFVSRMTEIDDDIPVDTDSVPEPESFPLSDFGSETESESFSVFDSEPIIEPSVVIPEPPIVIPEPTVVIPEPTVVIPEPPIVIPEPPITTTNDTTAEYTEIEINESMTVNELKSIADELGIKVPKSITKKNILELLNT